MFIRQKLISNKPYAYLVKTRWDKKSKKVRQKVHKYLGKIITLDRLKNTEYASYYEIENMNRHLEEISLEDLVRNLIELELFRHGYMKRTKYKMVNGESEISIDDLNGVYAINEGFLNKYTIRAIFKYHKLLDEDETNVPFKFAALFVNAGLDLDKTMFIQLYQKYFSDSLPEKKGRKKSYEDYGDDTKDEVPIDKEGNFLY